MAENADWIIDLFEPYGPVRLKRMFGGQGIYDGELFIGLQAFGQIWLKADEETRGLFEAAGSKPFVYDGKEKTVTIQAFWLLPDEALDDPDAIKLWAGRAAAASRRAQAAKSKKPGKAKKAQPARKSGTAVSRSKR